MNDAAFQAINDFFERYAHALENYDSKHMSLHYAIPCTLLSDDSSNTFSEASKLEGLFNQGTGFYKQFGITHARPEIWSKRPVSARTARVTVNWKYYDGLNQPVYNCDYFYMMKLDKNDQWKIELSVSINEKEQMDQWLEKNPPKGKKAKK